MKYNRLCGSAQPRASRPSEHHNTLIVSLGTDPGCSNSHTGTNMHTDCNTHRCTRNARAHPALFNGSIIRLCCVARSTAIPSQHGDRCTRPNCFLSILPLFLLPLFTFSSFSLPTVLLIKLERTMCAPPPHTPPSLLGSMYIHH